MIRSKTAFKSTFVLIALFFLLSGSIRIEKDDRMFMRTSFSPERIEWTKKVLIQFKDSIPDDTLTIFYSNLEKPIGFCRNIHTAVCSDTVCRLVNVTIYWEITGKFLGYSVPGDEELTKKEHEPFLEIDYTRLGEILADSSSLLGLYSPEEITPVKTTIVKADGITGATIPDLTSWIVPNAAYTSYTLWHLTYGSTRDSIQTYTRKYLLSKALLIGLLHDSDPYNQIRAFQWINDSKFNHGPFIEQALRVLRKGNYQAFGSALNFLKRSIDKERLQLEVVPMLGYEDIRIKIQAIEFLSESEKFSRPVALTLLTFLWRDDYYLVNAVLSLLDNRYDLEQNDLLKISSLLNSKNTNIANRVSYFLISRNINNQHLIDNLNAYSKLNYKR